MIIGILSDTHDHQENLAQALEQLRNLGIQRVLHCGDLSHPETAKLLEGFQVNLVIGNMDREIERIRLTLQGLHEGNRVERVYQGEMEGVRIAMTHGHREEEIHELAQSGEFDLLFHGHTHRRKDKVVDGSRIINPGALGGMRWQSRSFCTVDLQRNQLAFYELG